MASIHQLLLLHGGVIATHELHRAGFGRAAIRALLHRGQLIRVRQGWYASPATAPEMIAAFRVGGSLGCVSGLASLECWEPPDAGLHVSISAGSSRLRTATDAHRRLSDEPHPGITVHWHAYALERAPRLRTGIEDCLREMICCQPVEQVIAVADSALARQDDRPPLLTIAEWLRIGAEFPRLLPQLRLVDAKSGGGTESLTRFRCWRDHRLPLRSQVSIPGVGRVDFLLGDRLVIEVDGAAHHTGPERFEADRRRDALLSALGYRVLRFSYHQVVDRWTEVEHAILAAVARGDHR